MFCKRCGSPLADEAKFCPKCGIPVSRIAIQKSIDNTQDGREIQTPSYPPNPWHTPPIETPESTIVMPKRRVRFAIPVIIVAAVLLIGFFTCILIRNMAVVSLSSGLKGIYKQVDQIRSGSFSGRYNLDDTELHMDGEFELDLEGQYFCCCVSMDGDDPLEGAIIVDGNTLTYGLTLMGESYAEKSVIEGDIWSYFENIDSPEDIDLEQVLEDCEIREEVEDIVDLDDLDEGIDRMLKKLSSPLELRKIDRILDPDTEGFLGERTYTLDMDSQTLTDLIVYVVDLADREMGEIFDGDVLSEFLLRDSDYDDIEEYADSTESDILDEEISYTWTVDSFNRMKGVQVSGQFEGAEFDLACDFTYKGSKIDNLSYDFSLSEDYNKSQVSFIIDEINQIEDVEDSISDELRSKMDNAEETDPINIRELLEDE